VISKPGLRDKPIHPDDNLEMKEFTKLKLTIPSVGRKTKPVRFHYAIWI